MYQFTSDCLIGIGILDDEHRGLFKTINEIYEILNEKGRQPEETIQTTEALLTTLKKYAATHFAHEEAYMKDHHDPELPLQRKEHAQFTEKVNSIEFDSLEETEAIRVLQEMMEYLSRWLYRHILGSDTLIGKMKPVHADPVMLSFSEKYYTGVEFIDQEHRRLFEILSDLNEISRNEFMHDKYDAIVDVVEELKDYTVKHFQDEERYMRSIQYDGLAVQEAVHQSFIDKMDEIDLDEMDQNQQEQIDELIDFLASWLINHIMKMDQKIPLQDEQ